MKLYDSSWETCGKTSKALPISLPQCVGNNIVQCPTMASQCPKMSNNVWKQRHKTGFTSDRQRPNSWKWWNFRIEQSGYSTFHTFIHTSSNHFKMFQCLSKHWNCLIFQITGTKSLWIILTPRILDSYSCCCSCVTEKSTANTLSNG